MQIEPSCNVFSVRRVRRQEGGASPGPTNGRGGDLVGAVGDPEEVIEFLGVARIRIVGTFVFVFDVDAGGLHGFPGFAGGVGSAAFDGTTGGLWKGGVREGCGKSERGGRRQDQSHAEEVVFHFRAPVRPEILRVRKTAGTFATLR